MLIESATADQLDGVEDFVAQLMSDLDLEWSGYGTTSSTESSGSVEGITVEGTYEGATTAEAYYAISSSTFATSSAETSANSEYETTTEAELSAYESAIEDYIDDLIIM
jgi:hypothetical protein